jgi:plasmid stability protein
MATITVRNVPEQVVDRIKRASEAEGRSMEAEVRELLGRRYGDRRELLRRAAERRKELPKATAEEIERWIDEGRP